IPILLGSATPSLETWRRVAGVDVPAADSAMASAAAGQPDVADADAIGAEAPDSPATARSAQAAAASYHLLSLPHRVRNLQMPHVELVDMVTERRMTRGIQLIGQRL